MEHRSSLKDAPSAGSPAGGDGEESHNPSMNPGRQGGKVRRWFTAGSRLWKGSLPGRVLARYSSRQGSTLANGLAYGLLFAFFAALWTILSILGLVLSGNTGLQGRVIASVTRLIPGLSTDFFSQKALGRITGTLTWTGLVTLVMFWWTTTGWLDSLRQAVQSLFDGGSADLNPVKAKASDTLSVILVAVLFLSSSATGALSGGMVRRVLQALHLSTESWAASLTLDLVGLGSGLILNFLLFLVLLGLVGRVREGRALTAGSLIGSLAVTAMQSLGTHLLAGASSNPLLAPFAAVIGILIWFNLIARTILLCTALIAEWLHDDRLLTGLG